MSIWNPFKQKSPEQELQELIDNLNQSSSGSTPQLTPGQGSGVITTTTTPPGLFGQASGHTMAGGITQAQLSSILATYAGLSKVEQEEMNRLQLEHKIEIKTAKIATFKKLPSEMRQFVINALTWQDSLKDINAVVVDKPLRLKELEEKDKNSRLFSSSHAGVFSIADGSSMFAHILQTIGIPEGVTAEDLKRAHLEATLEEEILDEKEE